MNYLYQTDKEFSIRPQFRHSGCFFFAILTAMSDRFSIPMSHQSVIDFYDKELVDSDDDVDNEMFVENAQDLIDDFVGKKKVLYLGPKDSSRLSNVDEIEWGCWHRDGEGFNHFTWNALRGPGRLGYGVEYDPWSFEGSESVSFGKLISKRIAKIL